MASTKDDGGAERRRHPRYRLKRAAHTRSDAHEHRGALRDISASGASIEPKANLKQGSPVEVDIEEFGVFAARVTRVPNDDIFAVEFDIDEEEEDRLIAELTQLRKDIGGDDY